MMDRETRDEHVQDLVDELLPDAAAEAVTQCEAFSALAVNLAKAADDDPAVMTDRLAEVVATFDNHTLAWIAEASAPAGFLAKRVADQYRDREVEGQR